MTNEELAAGVACYYDGWKSIFDLAFRNVVDESLAFGLPNKVERAGIMHKNLRTELRPFCDRLDPVVRLVEQSDGLDYMLIDLGQNRQVMMRIGRYGDNAVRRNPSRQQRAIQGQMVMDFCESAEETTTSTIGYTVEDDYTEGGKPAWWLGRIVLLREHPAETEYMHDIAVYKKNAERSSSSVLASGARSLRTRKRHEIERIADELRRKAG